LDFKEAAILGTYIAKEHAEEIFRLLVNYQDISASEAASRLNMHIKTAQEFLEVMASLDILSKKEVYEKKRPYFRYKLKKESIRMEIDLSYLHETHGLEKMLAQKIRERKGAKVRFTTARNYQAISTVIIWIGTGRDRQERRISLNLPQGKFLYHLPFPSAPYSSVQDIMRQAEVAPIHAPEIVDIVKLLVSFEVIEIDKEKS
jgi:hypothetical protein